MSTLTADTAEKKPVWLDIPTIRDRLNSIDRLILQLLTERMFLVQEVGRIKHAAGRSLQDSSREAEMFARMEVECTNLGLNFDYISELWSTIIFYAKVMECEAVGIDSFLNSEHVDLVALRENLLALTKVAAPMYDEYCNGTGADAVKEYRARERHANKRAMEGLPGFGLDLDLGCATGQVAELLEERFDTIIGFDVSPDMCREARQRRLWSDKVAFDMADLSVRIPVSDASVDFLVANFGCASELGENFLAEVKRVLKPGGKAVLSYYNNDALLNFWFYPWPSTVRARLNIKNDTLEVWTGKTVFTVHAVGTTVKDLQMAFRAKGLEVVNGNIESYPTMQAIVPRFFFSATHGDSKTMTHIAREIDGHLAKSNSGLYRGTYILTEVRRK